MILLLIITPHLLIFISHFSDKIQTELIDSKYRGIFVVPNCSYRKLII